MVDRAVIFYDYSDKRKKYVRRIFVALALIVFGLISTFTFDIFFTLKKSPTQLDFDPVKSYAFYFTHFNDKKLTLTFDDGPNPIYTPMVAEMLKRHNVPATFFFIGENVLKNPSVARNIADQGFEIGNHTFTHAQEVHSSEFRLSNELRTTGKIIQAATQEKPIFYRPPFLLDIGSDPTLNPEFQNEQPLITAFREGYISVGADIDSKDWLVKSATELEGNVLEGAEAGGHVILLHDGGYLDTKLMVEVLEEMIVKLQADGYRFVSINELLVPNVPMDLGRTLSLGATDTETKDVSALQWFLYTKNFLGSESITGQFDKDTEIGLKNWQLSEGVVNVDNLASPEYGVAGEKTRKIISSTYQNKTLQKESYMGLSAAIAWFNLLLISKAIHLSQYIFWIVIILVIGRILGILGVFLYSLFKRKYARKYGRVTNYPDYQGGVSILIPGYNEEENIAATIYSILRDNYKPKEIIVINDGSKDKTLEVARGIERRYPDEVKVLDITNGGKANALNVGLAVAKYDVFVAMDADTIFAPNTINNLVRHMGDPKVGAVAGKVDTTRSKSILDIFQSIEYVVGQNIEKKVLSCINGVGVIPGPIGAWRRSLVHRVGGYSSETLVEDQDLTLAINTAGYKVLYEPEAIAYTETPHSLKDFLKQRVRWIYGTFQCAWKYKGYVLKNPFSSFSLVILPNILVFSMLVPLFYPVVDFLLILSLILGSWHKILVMYLLFTAIDMLYAAAAFIGEREDWKRLLYIPIQRLYYRQVIYYVVLKSVLLAIEGTEALWNKVIKRGESQSYYIAHFGEAVPIEESIKTEIFTNP